MKLPKYLDPIAWTYSLITHLTQQAKPQNTNANLRKLLQQLGINNLNCKKIQKINQLFITSQNNKFTGAYQRIIYLINQENILNKKELFQELQTHLQNTHIHGKERIRLYKIFSISYTLKGEYGLSPNLYQAMQSISAKHSEKELVLR